MSSRRKVAVIGAGWAGLAAAAALAPHTEVTLFEAGREAGGRARKVAADAGFSFLDNGQHLLIGAYRSVFRLLESAGVRRDDAFLHLPMQWYLHDGLRFSIDHGRFLGIRAKSLPAPFNLACALLGAENAPLALRLSLLNTLAALQKHARRAAPDQSIADWLSARRVPQAQIEQFWQPLVWGALNTPLAEGSLKTLTNVRADGVWADAAHSDYYLPKTDLGALFAEPLLARIQAQGGRYRPSCRVGRIVCEAGGVRVNGEDYDAAVAAVAPYHLGALLPESAADAFQAALSALRYHAITTVYLRYPHALPLPAAMTGFAGGTAQWLIDRSRLNGQPETAAVISLSEQHGALSADQWAARVHADVLRVCPTAPAPVAARTITEKRATAARPIGSAPPDQSSLNAQRIFLAGDWLHPRYPATLEAAVQSGEAAAQALLARRQ